MIVFTLIMILTLSPHLQKNWFLAALNHFELKPHSSLPHQFFIEIFWYFCVCCVDSCGFLFDPSCFKHNLLLVLTLICPNVFHSRSLCLRHLMVCITQGTLVIGNHTPTSLADEDVARINNIYQILSISITIANEKFQ